MAHFLSSFPLIQALKAIFLREMRLAWRSGGGGLLNLIFFLLLVTFMPFALGSDPLILERLGPSFLWLSGLLASLLGAEHLFQNDEQDGTLDLFLMCDLPLELVVGIKCLAHWSVTGGPLVLISPLLGLLLSLDSSTLWRVMLTLGVGTPALTFLGALGAALTISLRSGGLLQAILILPCTLPILIFGILAAHGPETTGSSFVASFLLLLSISLASLALLPWAIAAALRQTVS